MNEVIFYNIDGFPIQYFKGFTKWRVFKNLLNEDVLEIIYNENLNIYSRTILVYESWLDHLSIYEDNNLVYRYDFL